MAYNTTQFVARLVGISKRIYDENVGTGNSSNKAFQLDKQNVLASGYSLYYWDSTNTKTSLTETTDYTLDKESGRISLTAAGVTALGTNVLRATYEYLAETDPSISDSEISAMLDRADREIDEMTGRTWKSSTAYVDIIDGQKVDYFPHSTSEFSYGYGAGGFSYGPGAGSTFSKNMDEYDIVSVKRKPVLGIDRVDFMGSDTEIDSVQSYDDSAATYTNNTTKAQDLGENDFFAFASTPAAADIIYFGADQKFFSLNLILTQGAGTPTVVWEFYNGSAWTAVSGLSDGTSGLTGSGRVSFDPPFAWAKTTVNTTTSLYYVRCRLSAGSYTTSPKVDHAALDEGTVSQEISLGAIRWDSYGKISFLQNRVPSSVHGVRVAYRAGVDQSTDSMFTFVKELSGYVAGLQLITKISGGSWNSLNSFTLGSKSFNLGDTVMKADGILKQFRQRIDELYKAIGKRADLVVI